MEKWQRLEEDCVKELSGNYGDKVDFKLNGGSDSNQKDITVIKEKNELFKIEVKSNNSQCGQFVLLPDEENRYFKFSPKNKSDEESQDTKTIIEHMNKNFDFFLHTGTKGKNINFYNSKTVFLNWIISYYKSAEVQYFMTKKNEEFLIIPLDKIGDFFDVSATYRVKKSGSHNVAMKKIDIVKNYLVKEMRIQEDYIIFENKKLYVRSTQALGKKKFTIEEDEYIFSQTKEPNIFTIRSLSKTRNENVIFEIKLKEGVENYWQSFEEFIAKF